MGHKRHGDMLYLEYISKLIPQGGVGRRMSASKEINEVFEADIERMTTAVVGRKGLMALYEDADSLPIVGDIWPEGFLEVCEAAQKADRDNNQ